MRVREIRKIIEVDGWYMVKQVGSHKQLNMQPNPAK